MARRRPAAYDSPLEEADMDANATVVNSSQGCLEDNHSHPVPVTAGTRVRIVDWMVDMAQGQFSLCELDDGRQVLIARADLEMDDGSGVRPHV
jgi:hypothetical protein